MIEIGNRKGTPNESHFVLKVDASIKGLSYATYEFDVYADTAEEAKDLLDEFFEEYFSRYGFHVNERSYASP